MNPNAKNLQSVLLIEDNPADARLLRELLSDIPGKPFGMEHALTLEAGLHCISTQHYDLVLVDLSLPDSTGLETFHRVHRAAPDLPIIVMSGLDDEEMAVKIVQEGAQDYLVKGQVDPRLLGRSMNYAIERKRVEEDLAKERDLLHTLMDNLPDRIYVKDRQSRFLRISRALTDHFKLEHPRQAWMKSDHDFFSSEHATEALRDEQRVMETGEPILGKVERETQADESVSWVLTSKLPLRDKKGEIIGSFGISRDITPIKEIEEELQSTLRELQQSHEDLKSAQAQLIQAEKMQSIGRLAAGVAHEVKNPLAILRMGIDYFTDNLPQEDKNAALILEDMKEAVKRADMIILGLLDFSVPTNLKLRSHDLAAVARDSLALVRHELNTQQVAVKTHFAPDLPLVRIDGNKIKQVLVNVFTNAAQAMDEGGTLTVDCRAHTLESHEVNPDQGSRLPDRFRAGDPVVILDIHDTGSGFPEEILSRMFDPFFTTKPAGKGTGLGLTVSKKIIELHGGSIEMRNRKEGGASVRIMFKL